jgi:hypothetical protein
MTHSLSRALLLTTLLPLLPGCALGPDSIKHDRFDYTETISSSWKQQMLINMVKLRYGDTPVFLDVVSVISQYSLETTADLRFSWVHPVASVGDSKSTGASAKYTDRPTITYSPLSGERFARSIMKPIPPPALLSLIQAGYPIDLVLRACTQSVNGIRNRYGGLARSRQADPEFYPLLERLRRMQNSGALSLRVGTLDKTGEKGSENEGVLMTFRGKVNADLEQDVAEVRKTLGLDPNAREFKIAYGAMAASDKEVAILSRSMLEIIIDLGSNIQVPAQHVAEKRTGPTMPPESLNGIEIPALIRIASSSKKPDDSFVAVPYKDHWYWIDDKDVRSKAIFSFLMFVFSLTETQGKEGAPIVTIPAG